MSECRSERAGDSSDPDDGSGDVAVETAVERIRDRGRTVRDRQVQRALSELGDDLTQRERAEIEALGDRLVERLLAVPEAQLKTAAREGDDEAFSRALELFG